MRPPIEISRLEEARQALGMSEISIQSEPLAGGVMSYSEPGSWSNQAVGLGLDGPVSDAELDRLVNFYEERVCPARIEVSPFADASLIDGLAERGFTLRGFENVLARELEPGEDLRAAHPHGWPTDATLEVLDIHDTHALREWVEASTAGFRDLTRPITDNEFEITRRMALCDRCTCVIARVDGQPAGGSAMEILGETGALFATSVYPKFRRRGLQLAMMLERLERLRAAGCKLVTIGSKPGISTERNALRLGFEVAYSKGILERPAPGQ